METALADRPAAPSPVHAPRAADPALTRLRFLTCGSVDDGKSTLIGRLLHDAGLVPTDQLGTLHQDSRRYGTNGAALDFALLVDGLAAEREQGITIDVAYRYFATPRRAFIVADTPGHEQYTRNMATGASGAELAVILVDASKGILAQTRRHSFIAAILGIRHVVLAVNKMDLVGCDGAVFDTLENDYRDAVATLGFTSITAIPLSAREGDNVVQRSARMPWYHGPTLLDHLEQIDVVGDSPRGPGAFRLPVQWVNRPDARFRGYAGTIAAGIVRPGDAVRVLPGGRTSHVARIVTADGDLAEASAGQAITLTLTDEIDISRGDVICAVDDDVRTHDHIDALLLWTDDAPPRLADAYDIRLGTARASARISTVHHAVDIHSFTPHAVESLAANSIARVTLRLDRALPASPYTQDRELGGFILIDPLTHATVALGMVQPTEPEPARPAERRWRSFAKAVTWRITGSFDTFVLGWLITGRYDIAGGIAGAEMFTKIALFYLHERAWTSLSWGRVAPPSPPR